MASLDPLRGLISGAVRDDFEQPYMTPGINVVGGLRPASGIGIRPVGPPGPRVEGAPGPQGPGLDSNMNTPSGWAPGTRGGGRPIGSPNVAGEMKGIYGGGPARFNVPIDPRTGKPARGAANVWASMNASGWRPQGQPDYSYTFADADRDRAWALEELAKASAAGTLNPLDEAIYQAESQGQRYMVPGMYDSDFGNPLYNFDQYGNPTTDPSLGGFDSRGWDPADRAAGEYLPRMQGGFEPSQGDVDAGSLAYRKWFKGKYGYDPDPTDDNGNPRPPV